VLVFGLAWLLEPRAMRVQPGAVGREALEAEEPQPITGEPPGDGTTVPDPHASPSEGAGQAYLRG
jgi:hypothetical protein